MKKVIYETEMRE